MAVDGGLGVDASDALEMAHKEGVHCEKRSAVRCFDVAFAELWVEAFEQADLLVGKFEGAFAGMLFEAQQAFVFGEQLVAVPDAPYASRGDSHIPEG